MGLDLSFYRVKREVAEPHLIEAGTKDRWGYSNAYTAFRRDGTDCVFDAKSEIVYQRKNHYLKEILGTIYPYPGQCDYIQVTRLQAHHLLYVMKHHALGSYDIGEYHRFKQPFEQALNNFDWEKDYMFWSWV